MADLDIFTAAKPVGPIDSHILEKLGCPASLSTLCQRLNTPSTIQQYMVEHFIYNNSDTNSGFLTIIQHMSADCFEGGAGFAFPLLYLHGYYPKIVMIQADNRIDVDHTLVVYRKNNFIGSIAWSSYKTLMDRPPIFSSLRDLIMTYFPHYTCELPQYKGHYTVIGYSDPIDLVNKFGREWFFTSGSRALQHIYDNFTEHVYCTSLFGNKRYLYPPEKKMD